MRAIAIAILIATFRDTDITHKNARVTISIVMGLVVVEIICLIGGW